MYLVDAGANAHVTSIASVSGGSITNAFVGQTLDFRTTDGASFTKTVASPLATQIAKRGTLFAPILTKLYLLVIIIGAVLVFVPLVKEWGNWYLRLLAFVLSLAVWGWVFGKRGVLCGHAYQKTLFSPTGRPTLLSQLNRNGIDHVICAAELRSAVQVCFSGSFVYSYWHGHGEPDDLGLARAVQASACFPGGFPPARFPAKRHKFTGAPTQAGGPSVPPKDLVMSDGGVYDNMGDQWARGFEQRVEHWPELGHGRKAPNQLVVVNASGRVPWKPFRQRILPLIGEIAALLRVNDVMYINTTNVRRRDIVENYNPNSPSAATKLPGALIQITQSPFVVAEKFAPTAGPAGPRAQAALLLLGNTKKEWDELAKENATVSTTLKKLGVDVSTRLIYHGYVLTMCNLHVIFGKEFPLLSGAEIAHDRFRKLVS